MMMMMMMIIFSIKIAKVYVCSTVAISTDALSNHQMQAWNFNRVQ